MILIRFSMILAVCGALDGSHGCERVKRCVEPPVSPTDKVGITACFTDPLATDCFTTATAPFYACHCKCDRCSSPPLETCEATCFPSTTTTRPTTTSVSRRARLFAIGGYNPDVSNLRSVDVYDFESSSWTKAANLTRSLSYFGAATLNGMVYVAGGSNPITGATFVYDSTLDKWTSAPSMTTPREGHAVAELAGKIYAVGGFNGARLLRSAESFDQQANKWNKTADMSVERLYPAAAVVNDRLFAIGGSTLSSVEAYNSKTRSWSSIAPMNIVRSLHCAASVGDTLYAIGGLNLKSVEAYDFKSNKWTFVAEMSTPREGCGATAFNGLVYVLGGHNGSAALDTMEVYNPKTNTWLLVPGKMSTPRMYLAAALLAE